MDANPRPTVVLDISSDEEPPIEEPKVCDDDYYWLTELLQTVDKEKAYPREDDDDDDDDDEVVIVSEYNPPKPKSKPKSKSTNHEKVVKVIDDADDDCVVLDGDPDNPVADATDAASDGDDVLVVAEKGQVACRDFPHPRHLCVEFPFSSTPHERYCHMCHCYVCDSLAPCVLWGKGVSAIDHCHATDKQEMWKTQREIYRIGKDAPMAVSDTNVPMAAPQLNQATPLNITQLIPIPKSQNQVLTQNPMPPNQVSRVPSIRPCSSSRPGIPNIIRQSRNHQPGFIQGRNRLLPRSVSQQARGVHNVVQRGRGPNASNLGQRFVPSSTMFKRPGLVGCALATNHPTHVSSDNMNRAPDSRYTRNVASPAASKENHARLQHDLPRTNFESHAYQSSSQPNMGGVGVNIEPSRPEVYSQPIPQLNDCRSIYQSGNQGQNVSDSTFSNFDFHQVNNASQNDQQDSVDNTLRGTVSNKEPSTAQQFTPRFAGSESSQYHYWDHELDSMFLNHAVPVPSEGCMPHDLINVFSPESPTIDTGCVKRCEYECRHVMERLSILVGNQWSKTMVRIKGFEKLKAGSCDFDLAISCQLRAKNDMLLLVSAESVV